MIEHIIDLSEEAAELSIQHGQLVIARGAGDARVPVEEVAVLAVSHRRVRYTHAVLAQIAAHGGVLLACDERHLPVGLMLPLERNHIQAERFARQAQAAEPVKKRAWQQVVVAKVNAQAALLEELHGTDKGLRALAQKVKSGDTDNIEGQAARRYWPVLFGDRAFRRDREGADQNRLLNYGYAVLRAVTARAVCAAGLHPSLGIHHHNRYDAFCLADDLMEPFRPVVDRVVAGIVAEHGPEAPLDRAGKAALLGPLIHGRCTVENQQRTLFDANARLAASLAKVFSGERKKLVLPARV